MRCSRCLQPTREVVKPDNQLKLTEKELDEEIAKMLTANNPSAPRNIARYDQKLRTYKFEPMVEQNMVRARILHIFAPSHHQGETAQNSQKTPGLLM